MKKLQLNTFVPKVIVTKKAEMDQFMHGIKFPDPFGFGIFFRINPNDNTNTINFFTKFSEN